MKTRGCNRNYICIYFKTSSDDPKKKAKNNMRYFDFSVSCVFQHKKKLEIFENSNRNIYVKKNLGSCNISFYLFRLMSFQFCSGKLIFRVVTLGICNTYSTYVKHIVFNAMFFVCVFDTLTAIYTQKSLFVFSNLETQGVVKLS